jgi:hypothetical protein
MDVGQQYFIYGRSTLKAILKNHESLGGHSGIVEFKNGIPSIYRWVHQGSRPFGYPRPRQCKACKRLVLKGPDFLKDDSITFTCIFQGCQAVQTYRLPEGATWVFGGPPKKGEDTWIKIAGLGQDGDI